jgi:DNA-binding transcriptional ArsR family regulator
MRPATCKRSNIPIRLVDVGHQLDYDLDPTVMADTPERLKALADPTRDLIVDLVLERAMSVTDLAARIGKPKGTIAHHVEVLVDAGLLKVVRTRKVRAMEERFYGRVGRTIHFPDHDDDHELRFLAAARSQIDGERMRRDNVGVLTLRHARIPAERAREFAARVEGLALEFAELPRGGEVEYAFLGGVFPTNRPVAKRRRSRPEKEQA